MKFLSPEVAPYLSEPTIHPCLEYCCHIWANTPTCYLALLNKLPKQIRRTVGPSLATSLKPLAYHQHLASLCFFTGITVVNFHLN